MVGLDSTVQSHDSSGGGITRAGMVVEVGGRRESRLWLGLFLGSAAALIVAYAVFHGRLVVSLPLVPLVAGLMVWRQRRRPVRLELLDGVLELTRHPGRAPERLRLDELEEVGSGVLQGGRTVWTRRAGGQRVVLLERLDEDEAALVLRMVGGQPGSRRAMRAPRPARGAVAGVGAILGGAWAGAALLFVTESAHQQLYAALSTPPVRETGATDCAAPRVDVRSPAEGAAERAREKVEFAAVTMSTDRLLVHFDPRMEGVVVPRDVSAFRDSAVSVVEVGQDLARPIPDLRVDAHGVRATLSFGEHGSHEVDIPWAAVFALAPSSNAHGLVFADDVPFECVDAYARQAE